jgi:flagellar operon protein
MTPLDRIRADRIGPPQLPSSQTQQPTPEPQGKPSFADHLRKATEDLGSQVQFSGHAMQRAERRGIDLTAEQLGRIDKALDSVAAKGGRKALVMLDDLALIVGVDRRTVITLVNGEGLRDNVFTAIDAAVIA